MILDPQQLFGVKINLYFCKMFIKKISKPDRTGNKTYTYYRLVHSYKVGNKNRQQTILNLGKLETIPKEKHKLLADRIESLIIGEQNLLFSLPSDIEDVAKGFALKIIEKGIFPSRKKQSPINISKETEDEFVSINIKSQKELESKSIGGEWLVKQAFDKIGINSIFKATGMSDNESGIAQMLLTGRLIHPASELETERWLAENSGIKEIYDLNDNHSATRYRLYQAATHLYKNKDIIEKSFYNKVTNLFSQKNRIVIYDLTNIYFEGQMLGSEKSKFGRSKQKRSDRRLIGLALAIDSIGFVRHSKIYDGNISEPGTFETMIDDVSSEFSSNEEKPVVVMDAGISIEDNLVFLKEKNFDYVCVSRSKPKDYTQLTDNATMLSDNRGNKIEVIKVSVKDKDDTFLHIKSEQKKLKEKSMEDKISERFLQSMNYLKEGLTIPMRLKKIIPVHEKVGRIKKQFSKVAKNYKITYTENSDKGLVTDIQWELQEDRQSPNGEYFLRFSKETLSEKEIWDTYNMTRDVEATFRCLKTDLDIRPIFHKKDAYIEPHIWIGIFAYQIVNYIRIQLKESNINFSWSTIVRIMNGQNCSLQSAKTKNGILYSKLCTSPNPKQSKIYSALKYKAQPFINKTKVVTQL